MAHMPVTDKNDTRPGNGEVQIRITGLKKRFGEVLAVDGVDLEIFKGELFGLLGPNGAGKTTTIGLLTGLLRADAGSIFVERLSFPKDIAKARLLMGFCPQKSRASLT